MRDEAAKTKAKPGKFYCAFDGAGKELVIELLPYGQKLNSDIYCQQLKCLKLVIDQKWPELTNRRFLCSIRITPGPTRL
ncbi:hypothetical protein TNCV_3787181 [Trichonephila clavipes]|nr:hypothetical protein TNCV_3787181 [Trichonephila clavipes]